ncbi:hypothetical protein J7F03_22125 [Streptomyces sp. ISL-43]|uniref:hypothetical protein n=1 Tax=Streptomyces sp. ISL-43 TaxID=2819183 RepID=UPI001BEA0116|nr:hypothetical protein [Streptomyces sp. ISL-43]MBT2449726.1 hypothetical protein [Streptomyces sp. ISL-43]
MSTDLLLREQFVTDPAQILSEYVDGSRLSPQRASALNQLVYAVAATTDVLLWVRSYALTYRETPVSRAQFMTDFGRAVTEKQAAHVVFALLRLSLEEEAMPVADGSLLQILNESGLFDGGPISGTEVSTGTQFGTEVSGTHMSTGAAVISGTEVSTGTQFGTEVSGTQVSTGPRLFSDQFVPAVEALVEYAGRLRDRGLLDSVGGQ